MFESNFVSIIIEKVLCRIKDSFEEGGNTVGHRVVLNYYLIGIVIFNEGESL